MPTKLSVDQELVSLRLIGKLMEHTDDKGIGSDLFSIDMYKVSDVEDIAVYFGKDSRKMLDELSEYLYGIYFNSHPIMGRSDFRKLVARTVAKAVYLNRSSSELNSVSCLKDISEAVNRLTKKMDRTPVVFAFGCAIISDAVIEGVEIGPALIWDRGSWLKQLQARGVLDHESFSRISERLASLNHQPFEASKDNRKERAILSILTSARNGGEGFVENVIEIQVDNISGEFARRQALKAARLALTNIALTFNSPIDVLRTMGLAWDGPGYRSAFVTMDLNTWEVTGESMHRNMRDIGALGGIKWLEIDGKFGDYLLKSGSALKLITGAEEVSDKLAGKRTFLQALNWFDRACCEDDDGLSITFFVSCLEALVTQGRKGRGGPDAIRKLLAHTLGRTSNDVLFKKEYTSVTIDEFVKNVSQVIRNQVLHGRDENLFHDRSNIRRQAEAVSRLVIFVWVLENL